MRGRSTRETSGRYASLCGGRRTVLTMGSIFSINPALTMKPKNGIKAVLTMGLKNGIGPLVLY
jgi:hypothetical protein